LHDNEPVKDEEILAGFASLHQAMATGFETQRRAFTGFTQQIHGEMHSLRVALEDQIHGVRNDVARLEHRMLRRFDDIDERLDRHEHRIAALEARG